MGLKSLIKTVVEVVMWTPPRPTPAPLALPKPEARMMVPVPIKDMQPVEYRAFTAMPVPYKVEVARMYAEGTGRCMFCNRHLMDPRSRRVGYGQTCASRMGLPWG